MDAARHHARLESRTDDLARSDNTANRVLVLTPTGHDAEMVRDRLAVAGFRCDICADLPRLLEAIRSGAGAALIAEEGFGPGRVGAEGLLATLEEQEPWSDLPVLLLTHPDSSIRRSVQTVSTLFERANIVLLERPLRAELLVSAVRGAIRARRRQYQMRDLHQELARANREVLHSSEGLSRLATASHRVMAEIDLQHMLQTVAQGAMALTGGRTAACAYRNSNGQVFVDMAPQGVRGAGARPTEPGELFPPLDDELEMPPFERATAIRLTEAEVRAHAKALGLPEGDVPEAALLGVRMLSREGKANGVILVTDKKHDVFAADDEALLRQLATVASLALQHVDARLSLEESDRRKNQFLAMLSHELRNPLTPIRNSLYILGRATVEGGQARRAVSVIERQVGHMTRLVDELPDVTRISRGKIQLQTERLDVREIARRSFEDYRVPFAENHIELELTLPERPLWVSADKTRLSQVIGNLLNNSAKFTPASGKVSISVEPSVPPGQAVVRVRDTGVGIAPDMVPRVFDAFTQADATLNRSKGGLGLGLALVKGLVEMHGGTVSAKSDGQGKGAEFTVRLPLETAQLRVPPSSHQEEPRAGPRRVLVIEDNIDAAESLRDVLELGDHVVEIAYSGAEGTDKARAFRPDIVLCDIGLPGIDGYEVARRMRADAQLRDTTLVALTGYAGPEDVDKSIEAGFDYHLTKPTNLEKLGEVLARP